MTNYLCCSKCGECYTRCENISPPHEPEPYIRTTATNGDHDATAETSTATTASDADNKIESKNSHSYDIDQQCS